MAENRTQAWRLDEFRGVQRRATDRVKQVAPSVLQNFDFSRSGGYRFAYSAGASNVGDSVSLPLVDYDEYGMSLWADSLRLGTDEVRTLTGKSVASLPRYLIPGVGVATHANASTTDTYQLGGYLRASESETPVDLSRTTMTVTTPATGTSFSGSTVTVLAFVFAPTRAGLVAYQSFTETGVSVSAGDSVVVTLDDVLPSGYVLRAYIADEGASDAAFGGVADNNNLAREVYSDGANAMSISFIDYLDTANGITTTTNAVINPTTRIGGVTLHNRRLWAIASDTSFVGPFYYPYDPSLYWIVGHKLVSASAPTAFTAANDTALNSLTEFGIVIDGVRNTEIVRAGLGGGMTPGSYSQKVYVGRQKTASGTQLGVGFSLTYTVSSSGYFSAADIYWFCQVGGLTVSTGSVGSVSVLSSAITYQVFTGDRVEFAVDLSAGTFDVTEKDSTGTTIGTWSESGSLSGNTGTAGTGLQVLHVESPSSYESLSLEMEFESVDFYTDAALSSLTEETDAANWDGSSSTFTGDTLTWTIALPSKTSRSGGIPPIASLATRDSSIVYSDIGYPNYASSYDQYVKLPLLTSERLTAVASTPAGLLAFADNEAFLVRGDPALPDSFSVQRFSGTVGCDLGTRPAVMGGSVAFVWNGHVYAVSLGMGDVDFGSGLVELGSAVYQAETPFVQVVSDPIRRHFVAIDGANNVFRYSIDDEKWLTDPFTTTSAITTSLIPNGLRGLRYHRSNVSACFELVDYFDAADGVGGEPYSTITFEDLDVGDATLLKMWRRIRMYTNEGHTRTMALYYTINGASGSVFATPEGDGEYVFTFPAGLVSREITSLEFRLNGSLDDVVEPPLIVEYVPRYRRR